MVDTVTSQVYDGYRNYQVKLTNDSDGTGQSVVKVVDVTTMNPNPGLHMKLKRIKYSIYSMRVSLYWEATINVPIAFLGPGEDLLDFSNEYAGGWPNAAIGTAGVTGNILISTLDQVAGSSYTVVLELIKGV